MADTDISDLPTPDDISDLPVPQATSGISSTLHADPTDSMTRGEKFITGVGKGMVDTGRGIYQLAASIGHAAGIVPDEKMAQIQQQADDNKALDAPLMSTTAGRVGDVVGQAAPMLLAPEAGLVGSAAEGAIMGAVQPVTTGNSRLKNAGMGALGAGAGSVAGKIASGALRGFGGAGARQASVDLLQSEGVPVSVAQATKAKGAQAIERASAMTSDDASEFSATQGAAFNRAVLRRIGVNDQSVTAATPQVLSAAKNNITGVMDGVASRTNPQVDNTLLNDMSNVEQDASRQLPESDIGPITQNLNDILTNASQNGGYLDGTFVQKLNSNLGALSRNPSTAPIANDLQEAVHNAVQRYAAPDDAAALSTAQQQYRALKQIEPAVDPASGNISVPKLMSSMNSKSYGSRNQTLYAKGDQSLVDLARAARQVIPDNLGNSGTAERMLPGLTAVEMLASGDALKAGTKAAIGVSGLNAAGRALRSQGVVGSYLKSGIPGARAAAPVLNVAGKPLGYGTTETQPRDTDELPYVGETIARATGGKVDHDALVERLYQKWKSAKRDTDRSTKPLLNVPDATITKALDIAGAHV